MQTRCTVAAIPHDTIKQIATSNQETSVSTFPITFLYLKLEQVLHLTIIVILKKRIVMVIIVVLLVLLIVILSNHCNVDIISRISCTKI